VCSIERLYDFYTLAGGKSTTRRQFLRTGVWNICSTGS